MEPSGGAFVKGNVAPAALPALTRFAGRQRALVKAQDGCDAFCTYCIVPHLRRRIWSRPADEIVGEVRAIVAAGHKEIVLCGVSLGAYDRPTTARDRWPDGPALPELLGRAAEVKGLWRLRLSSLHPADVTDELLEQFARRPNIAPHLHLPLQSGSDRILDRMNRPYTAGEFLAAVRAFRRTVGRGAVTTDVIVGFPGESEEDFEATVETARQAGFSKIHIFPFSARPGTAAWQWRKDAPPAETVRRRCRRLAEVEAELARSFRSGLLGRAVEVLVERPNARTPAGCARGLTGEYVEAVFPCAEKGSDPFSRAGGGQCLSAWLGRVVTVRVESVTATGVLGRAGKGV